jgi:hypothetical protein
VYEEHLIFNPVTVDYEIIGESVPLRVNVTEIERPDGVTETNFEVSIDVWVALKQPEDVELMQTLNITVNPVAIPET